MSPSITPWGGGTSGGGQGRRRRTPRCHLQGKSVFKRSGNKGPSKMDSHTHTHGGPRAPRTHQRGSTAPRRKRRRLREGASLDCGICMESPSPRRARDRGAGTAPARASRHPVSRPSVLRTSRTSAAAPCHCPHSGTLMRCETACCNGCNMRAASRYRRVLPGRYRRGHLANCTAAALPTNETDIKACSGPESPP